MLHSNKIEIAVLGAGSVGCYIGGCLISAGEQLVFIGHVRVQKQLLEHGLHLSNYKNRQLYIAPEEINFTTQIEGIATADYILLTVKSGDTAQAASDILDHAKPSAVIVSFQNGIQNARILQSQLPNHQLVKAMVPFNILSSGNGWFHCGTEGNLAIEAKDDQYHNLIRAFEKAGLPFTVYPDISGVQWGKLIMNLNNAVNALCGEPLLAQLNKREFRKIMSLVIAEALTVMKHAGITPARTGKVIPKLMPHMLLLPNWLFKRVASATLKIDPKARSSMYEDLMLRRKTEIDFLNGEIVNLAERHKISAPINQVIVGLVKDASKKRAGSPRLSAKQIQTAISKASVTDPNIPDDDTPKII